jgi:prepilin-type N-terminal cleavage/methylation domain-containing protein
MDRQIQRGFTLWELLITVAVMGIVLGLGIPNFLEFQRNNVMAANANELVTGLYLARSEAVKRQAPVTLCASANPTAVNPVCGGAVNGGFIVFVDDNDTNGDGQPDGDAVVNGAEQVLVQQDEPGGTMNVFADNFYISYAPTGFVRNAPALGPSATTVLYCDERGNKDTGGGQSSARVVTIALTGRPQMLRTMAEVANAAAALGAAC